jgi:hypothetical protein
MSIPDLFEREDGVDHGLNRSTREQRHNFGREGGGGRDLLPKRSRAHDGADGVQTFAQYLECILKARGSTGQTVTEV